MSDVGAIRDAMVDALASVPGLRASSFVPDNLTPPHAVVGPPTRSFHLSFQNGLDMLEIPVFVLVARQYDRSSQRAVDDFLGGSGSKSVRTALEADRTFAATACSSVVREVTPMSVDRVAELEYVGAEFTVHVYATGT